MSQKNKGNPNIKEHGFGKNPKNINKTGANKGSKWNATLLKELLNIDLSNTDLEQFKELEQKFPNVFGDNPEKNFHLFMELKQISLVFDKNGAVAQKAIDSIKNRIEGKPLQSIEQTTTVNANSFNIKDVLCFDKTE